VRKQLVVRIPRVVKSDLGDGALVDLKLVEGKVILIPVRKRKLTLQQLLAGVTKKTSIPKSQPARVY
jgi:antitoxin component of MazEF toxin-antitoxin module